MRSPTRHLTCRMWEIRWTCTLTSHPGVGDARLTRRPMCVQPSAPVRHVAWTQPQSPCTWGCSGPQMAGTARVRTDRNPPPPPRPPTIQSLQAHWATAGHVWHLLPFWSPGEGVGRGLEAGEGASRSQRPFLGSPESLPADSALGAGRRGAAEPQVCPRRLPGGASIKAWEGSSHSALSPSPDPSLPFCPRWSLSVNGAAQDPVPAWWELRPAAHTSGFFRLNVGGAMSSQPSEAPS